MKGQYLLFMWRTTTESGMPLVACQSSHSNKHASKTRTSGNDGDGDDNIEQKPEMSFIFFIHDWFVRIQDYEYKERSVHKKLLTLLLHGDFHRFLVIFELICLSIRIGQEEGLDA